MHILIALTYYRPHYSGLTIYAERQARALAQRGHKVTILTSRFDKSLPTHEWRNGVEVIRLDVAFRVSKGVIMPGMPLEATRLARRADVINLHAPQFDAAPIALTGRLLGKPVVLTYHCDLHLPHGFIHAVANRVSDFANGIAARAANAIVHNTRDYAEASPFLRRYLPKIVAIYPPVETASVGETERAAFRTRYDLRPDDLVIGMAARLAAEKGVEVLAKAMPAILQRYPQARVLMVGQYKDVFGEQDYARRVMQEIEPIREHWSWLGVLPDHRMAAFFHECDVLAVPSLNSTESYGMVQIEAMACGTPVVASDLPGVRVPVGVTGAGLIAARGDPTALAQAIGRVLETPERFRGHTAELIGQSTLQAVAERYEELFSELIRV